MGKVPANVYLRNEGGGINARNWSLPRVVCLPKAGRITNQVSSRVYRRASAFPRKIKNE